MEESCLRGVLFEEVIVEKLLENVLAVESNVNVATFTTSLYVTLNITNTSAMGAFFVQYTKRTAKEY